VRGINQNRIGDSYVGKVQSTRCKNSVGDNDSAGGIIRTSRNLWLTIALCCGVIGCTTIKKATVVATGAALGATAGTVLSGGVAAPILGAMTSAFVTDVATEISHGTTGGNMDCAADNFWTLLGSLIQMGGWALILIVLAPMVLGWILPGPLERKKK
jgi:hypothetical protein